MLFRLIRAQVLGGMVWLILSAWMVWLFHQYGLAIVLNVAAVTATIAIVIGWSVSGIRRICHRRLRLWAYRVLGPVLVTVHDALLSSGRGVERLDKRVVAAARVCSRDLAASSSASVEERTSMPMEKG